MNRRPSRPGIARPTEGNAGPKLAGHPGQSHPGWSEPDARTGRSRCLDLFCPDTTQTIARTFLVCAQCGQWKPASCALRCQACREAPAEEEAPRLTCEFCSLVTDGRRLGILVLRRSCGHTLCGACYMDRAHPIGRAHVDGPRS